MKIKLATILVLVMAAFVCPYYKACAQGCTSSAGANTAASFSTATYSGAGFSWSNPGNAQMSDGSYAMGGMLLGVGSTAYSDFLTIQNFGFSIPSTATICEIIVEVQRSASGLGIGGDVTDQSVRLLQNGALYGADLANPAVAWPASDGTVMYGNAMLAGTWGGSWLPSDVNNPNFGVAISTRLRTGLLGLFMRGRINQVRVTIVYDPNTLLSIGLENFSATRSPDGMGHLLSWTAGAGAEGDRFVIQRSGDSRDWMDLAVVPATTDLLAQHQVASKGSYTYTDHSPLGGANFYRVKMMDAGGRSIYSTVSEIMKDKVSARCWPNPIGDMIYTSGLPPVRVVMLKDLQGRIIYTGTAAVPTGDWEIPAAGLRPGIYFVQVGAETFKLLKQAK